MSNGAGRPFATEREKQIYNLLVQGYSTPEIASKLFMAQSGVRYHVTKLFFKHNVKTHAKLIAKHWMNKTHRLTT